MMGLYETLYPWIHLAARLLFALLFLLMGWNHVTKVRSLAGYARSKGLPMPEAAVFVSGLMMLAGSVTIALGWHRFIGAGLIAIFLFPTAFIMHPFWKETDAMARQGELIHFYKDLALAGGALFMAAHAGLWWPLSLGG